MPSTLTRRRGFPHKRRWAKGFAGGEVLPVTFPSAPLSTRVYIALGADLTADWRSWNWLDITDRVRHDLGITVTVGRGDERGQVTPSKCTIKLTNDDGYLVRRNPFSPYFGLLTPNTPIWIQLDPGSGYVDRYHGYVNEWPTTWADESASDTYVTIQCSGVMRRLTQGQVLRSPVYRSIIGRTPTALQPIAYWPMEDGSGSTQFASAIPGVSGRSPAGSVSYAADSDLEGSDPLPTFSNGASVTFQVPEYDITNAWMVQLVVNVPSDPGADTVLARFETGNEGAIARYDLVISPTPPPSAIGVRGYGPTGNLVAEVYVFLDGTGPANPLPADFYGRPWSVRFLEKLLGVSDSAIVIFLSGQDGNHTNGAGSASSAPSTIRSITPIAHPATHGVTFGHVAVHADAGLAAVGAITTDVIASVGALGGWNGEQAHERIKRLCREEGIQAQALAGRSAAMGPQGSGTLLAELRACEAADQGVLYEHEFGFGYQALSERTTLPVHLDLDFDAGHIAGVPQPADDEQRLVNRFTASRPGGSSGTAELDTGTLGTDPGGPGIHPGSASVNVETDNQLVPYAGWKVHLGTVDEDRWPQIGIRLHSTPDLIPAWLSAPFGARINVANPPSQMNPYTIDAIVEGKTERWDEITWVAALATSPASPYQIGVAGDSTTGGSWLQTGRDTQLLDELATGGTRVTSVIDGPLFSTSAADIALSPLSIVVDGREIMPVSSITSVVADTFTRTESNGWGTSESGQLWTVSGVAASNFSTGSGLGVHSVPSAGSTLTSTLDISIADVDLYFDVISSVTPTGAGFELQVQARYVDDNNFVDVRLFPGTGGAVTMATRQVADGVETTDGFPTVSGATPTTTTRVRLYAVGSTLQAKAWPAASSEPSTWDVDIVATHLTAGSIRVRSIIPGGVTNVPPFSISWDNLSMTNPQIFTVTRTLALTHPAGSSLAVHRPLIAAY